MCGRGLDLCTFCTDVGNCNSRYLFLSFSCFCPIFAVGFVNSIQVLFTDKQLVGYFIFYAWLFSKYTFRSYVSRAKMNCYFLLQSLNRSSIGIIYINLLHLLIPSSHIQGNCECFSIYTVQFKLLAVKSGLPFAILH